MARGGKEYQYQHNDRAAAIRRRRELVRKTEIMRNAYEEEEAKKEKVQAKLEINEPGDEHEQEADAVAKAVVSGSQTDIQRSKEKGRIAAMRSAGYSEEKIMAHIEKQRSEKNAIQKKDNEEKNASLMAKDDDGGLNGTTELQTKLEASKGGGESLDDKTKGEMESKMGADLSDVKIHTGTDAHEMAEGINAKAFTHGQDIYFKDGNYDTNSNEGKELLAHELVHTQQQKEGVERKVQRQPDPDPDETKPSYSFSIKIPSVMNGKEWLNYIEKQVYNIKNPEDLEKLDQGKWTGLGIDDPITKDKVGQYIGVTIEQSLYRHNMAIVHPGYDYKTLKQQKESGGTVGHTGAQNKSDQGGDKNKGGKSGDDSGQKGGKNGGQQGGTKGGVTGGEISGAGKKDRNKQYDELSPADKKKVIDETDKRYSARTGKNTQIKTGDKGQSQLWNDIRDEVLAEMDKLGNVPDRLKPLVGDLSKISPEKKEQYFRIITKLESLTDEDIQALSVLKTKLPVTDLDTMEKFLDAYIADIETMRKEIADAMQKQQDQQPEDEKTLEQKINDYWKNQDMSGFQNMSVEQKEQMSRKQMNDVANIQMQYMWDHKLQSVNDFAKAATLMNMNEVGEGAAKDMEEMANGDANAWARFAAGAGWGAKMSGWVAAVAVVCMVIAMATGVGEVAALISLAVYAMATSIVLSTAESELRVKAAGQQQNVEGFQEQTTKGGTALASAVIQTGLLIAFEGIRITVKSMPGFIKGAKEISSSFRERIASLLDKDQLTPELRTQLLSDIAAKRALLMEVAENAKAELASKAQLLDGLTPDDFVAKLEAGDKDLMELIGITEDKVPVYRQLLGTAEGKSAIGSMIKSLHDGLINQGPDIINQAIKPFIDDLNAYEGEINNAQTAGEARSATSKYESSLSEDNLTKRAKAQQDQSVQDYLKKAQEKLKEQQEQAQLKQLQDQLTTQPRSIVIDGITIADVKAAIMAVKDHVLKIESIITKKGKTGFQGCHSKIALETYVVDHPGSTWNIENKSLGRGGAYDGNPKIYDKDGSTYVKLNNNGISSFFPDDWSIPKILAEVEYAIRNNKGKYTGPDAGYNEYYGFSSDGSVEIHFYLKSNGTFGSFFAKP